MNNKTFAPNPTKIKTGWHYVDASGKVLGRFATEVVKILMGKDKPEYATNQNIGDKVVIINAEKITVTGNKAHDKLYRHYTGFPGGLREETFEKLKIRKPEDILKRAISGMLPKNKLRKDRMSNLYIYKGTEHPHKAHESK